MCGLDMLWSLIKICAVKSVGLLRAIHQTSTGQLTSCAFVVDRRRNMGNDHSVLVSQASQEL